MASKKQWNGTERFHAIKNIIGTVIPARETLNLGALDADSKASQTAAINAAIRDAARESGASEKQISDWIESFATFGRAGLTSPVEAPAAGCVQSVQGTFELVSRFTDGAETAASSMIYYDTDPVELTATKLVTMWAEENHFGQSQGDETVLLLSLSRMEFRQNGPYRVDVTSTGEIVGDFGPFKFGQLVEDEFSLERHGENEAMSGVPVSRVVGGEGHYIPYQLVAVTGDSDTLVFSMFGQSGTDGAPATVDVVDTYRRISNSKPLVAGIEPIVDYFERKKAEIQSAFKRGSVPVARR